MLPLSHSERPLGLALSIALLLPALNGCREAGTGSESSADSYRAEIESWHQERIERLRADDGWLTLAGLHWLRPGDTAFGVVEHADVQLPGGAGAETAGALTLRDDGSVLLTPAPGAQITLDGVGVDGATLLRDDRDGPAPELAAGSVRFHLIHRGDRVGLRVRDLEHPRREAFGGVERYPVDPAWRLEARFHRHAKPTQIPIVNVLGQKILENSPGWVELTLEGTVYRLLTLESEDDDLFLVFGDPTNGKETYGGGRFLYTDPPTEDGSVIVDFNRAYNPPCVFSPYSTCPLPPAPNRLRTRVEAGEKKWDPTANGSAS